MLRAYVSQGNIREREGHVHIHLHERYDLRLLDELVAEVQQEDEGDVDVRGEEVGRRELPVQERCPAREAKDEVSRRSQARESRTTHKAMMMKAIGT